MMWNFSLAYAKLDEIFKCEMKIVPILKGEDIHIEKWKERLNAGCPA